MLFKDGKKHPGLIYTWTLRQSESLKMYLRYENNNTVRTSSKLPNVATWLTTLMVVLRKQVSSVVVSVVVVVVVASVVEVVVVVGVARLL